MSVDRKASGGAARNRRHGKGEGMGARSGKEYLVRLQQHSPEFWFGGERVDDCTSHPATAGAATEIARLYDLVRDDDHQENALFPSPLSGDLVSAQFLVPTSRDDLV